MLNKTLVTALLKKLWIYYYKSDCDRQVLAEQVDAFMHDCSNINDDVFTESCVLARSRCQFFPTTRDVMIAAREITIKSRGVEYFRSCPVDLSDSDVDIILKKIDNEILYT